MDREILSGSPHAEREGDFAPVYGGTRDGETDGL
jgi:hypothetical protein